jgi:hypothetical protein
MSREFVAHILIDIYVDKDGMERGVELSEVAPSQADMEYIKGWLKDPPKNHIRLLAPNTCFDSYTYEELWGDNEKEEA